MNADIMPMAFEPVHDVRRQASIWRGLLEEVWAKDTAYPLTDPSTFCISSSAGQCAVSSILLINRLPSLKPLNPQFVLGRVHYRGKRGIAIDYHGWIEFFYRGDTYILDITADQAEWVHQKIVLCKKSEAAIRFGLEYITKKTEAVTETRKKEVWDRYIRLSRKLGGLEVGEEAIIGLQSRLDLTSINDNDIARYLTDKIQASEDPVHVRVLSVALELSKHYSFSDTRTYPRPDHPIPIKRRSASFTLVAVVASLRTTLENEQRVVDRLLERYTTDDELFDMNRAELVQLLRPVGLAESKADVIINALNYIDVRYGRSWQYLAQIPLDVARKELLGLRGLGPKAVDCILTVGLGRPSIAVDVNVFRVTARVLNLPWSGEADYGNNKQVTEVKKILDDIVRSDAFLAQILHTLFLLHGKNICKARCSHSESSVQDLCLRCDFEYLKQPWQKGLF